MYNFLKNSNTYNEIISCVENDSHDISIFNLTDSSKIHFISTFSDYKKLIVARDENRAKQIFSDYKFYCSNVMYYPEKDILFGNASANIKDYEKNRSIVIDNIINNDTSTTIITAISLLEKTQSKNEYINNAFSLKVGKETNFDDFVKLLSSLNYERVLEVYEYGEFAVRGGIIDIYLYNYEYPLRIDFFGDEVTSIKYFNLESKRSFGDIDSLTIYPQIENDMLNSSILSFFDYNKTLIIFDENKEIQNKLLLVEDMVKENIERRINANINSLELQMTDIFSVEELKEELKDFKKISLNCFDDENNILDLNTKCYINTESPSFNKTDFENIIKELKNLLDNNYSGYIVINSHTKAERLKEMLFEHNIRAYILENSDDELVKGHIGITFGTLQKGFKYLDDDLKYFVFSENDLFNIHVEKKRRIKYKDEDKYQKITSLNSLKVGDYVVHTSHGVGVYKGTKVLNNNNITSEYIVIEYADNGILYIPCTNLDLVMKYQSGDGKKPKLHKLNSVEWQKTKTKVKKEIEEMAKDLIELYATRYSQNGFEFSKDNIWQNEFEETFPYEETFDQVKAIELTKRDMESPKCMDRLLCGDVGFGKTEIALRASFKAVQDSKQVCLLAPTTILCQQHYNTFKDRMSSFPIKVDYLSRFKTKKEISDAIKKIKSGETDIVIGTHRLLSNDIEFKDLGLLIVDEEQRFGVTHKEKIKKLKTNVDVLTLSATPIPRTLNMSLSGIRDLSLLSEAPPERVPIQTYVLEYNPELIREAIERELKRGGQVFFVHNRVMDIYDVANEIQKIVPDANIGVAHGKMTENELENVMEDFVKGDINVLISTTIIETGLDIPNANTLIVMNADKFGISQLYQLRGRIGRSNKEAYAFFMYKRGKELSLEQEKRLKAIKEFSSLGSGIKIAMRDLEIRGAGNILGKSQSGHIEAVGYEMYYKLLNQAMKYLNIDNTEKKHQNEIDVSISIDINAYIPTQYIESEDEKILMYKKISICESEDDIEKIKDELVERFGKIPEEVNNLLYIAHIKNKCRESFITELKIKEDYISITFCKDAEINVAKIPLLVEKYNGDLKFLQASCPSLVYKKYRQIKDSCLKTLNLCEKMVDFLRK